MNHIYIEYWREVCGSIPAVTADRLDALLESIALETVDVLPEAEDDDENSNDEDDDDGPYGQLVSPVCKATSYRPLYHTLLDKKTVF